MKKIFTLALMSIMALAANATELFTGSQYVTWGQGLQISADQFADAKAGDKIVVTYTGASDAIEFKVIGDFHRLPGSRNAAWINGDGTFEQFLTVPAVAQLKENGLEMIGNNFTVTKVELLEGKDNVTENTVWTGYFWMDEWSTLEIVTTSFDGINWSDVKALRFYSEAGRTDYVINVKFNWEPEGHIADNSTLTMTNEYAELNLEGINVPAFLEGQTNFMVQCNKEGGDPFNFTSIELVKKDETGVKNVNADENDNVIYNINGQRVGANHKGIVIKNGRKYLGL